MLHSSGSQCPHLLALSFSSVSDRSTHNRTKIAGQVKEAMSPTCSSSISVGASETLKIPKHPPRIQEEFIAVFLPISQYAVSHCLFSQNLVGHLQDASENNPSPGPLLLRLVPAMDPTARGIAHSLPTSLHPLLLGRWRG